MGVINRFQPGWGHLNHHHHNHILTTIEGLDVTGRSKTPMVQPARQLVYTGCVVMVCEFDVTTRHGINTIRHLTRTIEPLENIDIFMRTRNVESGNW